MGLLQDFDRPFQTRQVDRPIPNFTVEDQEGGALDAEAVAEVDVLLDGGLGGWAVAIAFKFFQV